MAFDFDDLIRQCQPAMAKNSPPGFAEGRTWARTYIVKSKKTGELFDFTGCTGECVLLDYDTWAEVIELDVTLTAQGVVTVSKAQSGTTGLLDTGQRDRRCRWGLTVTKGTQSADLWIPHSSEVPILTGA